MTPENEEKALRILNKIVDGIELIIILLFCIIIMMVIN